MRGDRWGHDPTHAVGGTDAGEAHVELELPKRRGEHRSGRYGTRATERGVRDEDSAMCAHRQRLAECLGSVGRSHRQQCDLTVTAGRLDELERGLEDILVV